MEIKIDGQSFEINKEVLKQAEIVKGKLEGHDYIRLTPEGGNKEATMVKVNDLLKALASKNGLYDSKTNNEINKYQVILKARAGILETSDIKMKQLMFTVHSKIANVNEFSNLIYNHKQEVGRLYEEMKNAPNQEAKQEVIGKLKERLEAGKELRQKVEEYKWSSSVTNDKIVALDTQIYQLKQMVKEGNRSIGKEELENKIDDFLLGAIQDQASALENNEVTPKLSDRIEAGKALKKLVDEKGSKLKIDPDKAQFLEYGISELEGMINSSDKALQQVNDNNEAVAEMLEEEDDVNSIALDEFVDVQASFLGKLGGRSEFDALKTETEKLMLKALKLSTPENENKISEYEEELENEDLESDKREEILSDLSSFVDSKVIILSEVEKGKFSLISEDQELCDSMAEAKSKAEDLILIALKTSIPEGKEKISTLEKEHSEKPATILYRAGKLVDSQSELLGQLRRNKKDFAAKDKDFDTKIQDLKEVRDRAGDLMLTALKTTFPENERKISKYEKELTEKPNLERKNEILSKLADIMDSYSDQIGQLEKCKKDAKEVKFETPIKNLTESKEKIEDLILETLKTTISENEANISKLEEELANDPSLERKNKILSELSNYVDSQENQKYLEEYKDNLVAKDADFESKLEKIKVSKDKAEDLVLEALETSISENEANISKLEEELANNPNLERREKILSELSNFIDAQSALLEKLEEHKDDYVEKDEDFEEKLENIKASKTKAEEAMTSVCNSILEEYHEKIADWDAELKNNPTEARKNEIFAEIDKLVEKHSSLLDKLENKSEIQENIEEPLTTIFKFALEANDQRMSELLDRLHNAAPEEKNDILGKLSLRMQSKNKLMENLQSRNDELEAMDDIKLLDNNELLLNKQTRDALMGTLGYLESIGKRFAYIRESLPLVENPVEREEKLQSQNRLIERDELQMNEIFKTIDENLAKMTDKNNLVILNILKESIKTTVRTEDGIRALMESGIKDAINPPSQNTLGGNISLAMPRAFGDNHLFEETDSRQIGAINRMLDLYISNFTTGSEKQNWQEYKSIINKFDNIMKEFKSGSVEEKAEAFKENLMNLRKEIEKFGFGDKDTSYESQFMKGVLSRISPSIAYLEMEARDGITLKSLAKNENPQEVRVAINNKKQILESIKGSISAESYSTYSAKLTELENNLQPKT